ncbi:MAG: glycosyltransferase family 2 protein [Bacteroidales bacterium]|nr:glycosyltransferase family 2 protein [Bacteroidales bacterium]
MSARTAIVILNWNGEKFLRQFLHTLVENTNPELARICIIDNYSTDGSLQFLSENFPQIQLVKLDKNCGFAGGYNRGLTEIDAEYFMLLNSDVEVGKDWISPLVELMDSDPTIGVCGPKLIDFNNREKFEYAGAAGGYIDKYGYPFCRGRLFESIESDNGQHDTREDCLWISGAALFIRSKLFFEVGGFDDDFFAHQEEIDLCWRVQNSGYRVVCEPKSEIYHVGGGALPKSNPFKTFLNFRNNLYLVVKNLPDKEIGKVLFVRFFLDVVAAVRMIFQGNFKECHAVFRAYGAFLKNKKKMKQKRLSVIRKPSSEIVGMYCGSIVFKHFLSKKQTSKEIFGK